MCDIEIKEVETLCYNDIIKLIPSSFQHMKLLTATIGPQLKDTVIIGNLKDITKKKPNSKGKPLMKCTFEEVVKNGRLRCFEAFFYENYVSLMDECLEKIGSAPSWVIFSNTSICKNTGIQEPWSPFNLKVIVRDELIPKITLIVQSKKVKKVKYISLNNVTDGNRHNVFVMVKEIVKPPTTLANKSKHTMLALTDPSCIEEGAKRADLLLHIFFNDPKDSFPKPIEVGDVLRIRDMLGDFYKKEQKLYGKVYNSKAITIFRINENENDDVIHFTSCPNYEITEQDRIKALHLRHWWEEVKDDVVMNGKEAEEDHLGDSILIEKKIKDVTQPSNFNIYCLIKDVRIIESHEIVILRVADGSCSKVYTTTCSFQNATQDLCSKTDNAIFESEEIDVAIFEPLFKEASQLKVGDFVQLVNVTCTNLVTETNSELLFPILDFNMNGKYCKLIKLYHTNGKVKEIKRRLLGKDVSEGEGSEDDIILLAKKLQEDGSFSLQDLPSLTKHLKIGCTENGIKNNNLDKLRQCPDTNAEESQSTPPKSKSDTNSDDENLPSTSGLGKSLSPTKQGTKNNEKEESSIEENGFSEPPYSALNETFALDSSSQLVTDLLNNDKSQSSETEGCKRKGIFDVALEAGSKKIKNYPWTPKQIYTECNIHPKSSLTEFYTGSKSGDFCRAWVLLKHIHFLAETPFKGCNCLTCFHDWVWGLCTKCGSSFSSLELRKLYSQDELLSNNFLRCSETACDEERSEDTVVPFIKLTMCLEDLNNDNGFAVDLSGDGAELFFGVAPSFKWTIGTTVINLQQKMLAFQNKSHVTPFQVCLTNCPKSDGTRSIQICSTKTNFL